MTPRYLLLVAPLALCAIAHAAAPERVPTAVLWLGDATTLEDGQRVVAAVNDALSRSKSARPLDSAEDRRVLVEGGAVTRAQAAKARAEAALGKLKPADGVRELEAAEQILLGDVPIMATQRELGDVERGLLVLYDQLGRVQDATRAAERLTWTAGDHGDVQALLDKHLLNRAWQPADQPVRVVTDPPGAQVYRNLQPVGVSPVEIPGGDPSIDVVDVEAPGYRRAHAPLGRAGGEITLKLEPEDRLGAMVDRIRLRGFQAEAEDVTALGRRLGAGRVLAIAPDGQQKVRARWLDVGGKKWAQTPLRTDAAGQLAMDKLAAYVAPPVAAAPPAPAGVEKKAPPAKSKWGAWGKWYTWVAAGGVLALVAGLLIAQNVGDDSLKINVAK